MKLKNVFKSMFAALMLFSCQTLDKEQLTRDYYQSLEDADFERVLSFQYDSVRVIESNYSTTYAPKDYVHWLQWDAVFRPTYTILDLEVTVEGVAVMISKDDPRIRFLNDKPLLTKERLTFKGDKIYSLNILEYVNLNNATWNAKREKLVGWINKNHPELDGFIYDQTLEGGLNYKKALKLYQEASNNGPQ